MKNIVLSGGLLMALAVVLGAFGAHALKSKLPEAMIAVYKTGVEYHFYHALGILFIGIVSFQMPSTLLNWAFILLLIGIILFSGSLYLLAITGIKKLGMITPLGGLSFIAGWIVFVVAVVKHFK